MAWAWDAPSGVYKNHTLSSEIRREAVYDIQTLKFLRPEPGFGKRKGDTLTISRVGQLPVAGRVGEQDTLPNGRPSITTKSVTVSEWGYKIPMTEFEKNLAYFDINNQFQMMLKDQMALTMDLMAATALKTTPYKYTPQVGGGVFATNGTAGGVATANLAVADLRVIRDQLRKNKAKFFRGNKFMGILSTRAARGIKNDPEYKDWNASHSTDMVIAGMLDKEIEDFILLETNNVFSFLDLPGTSTVCGEAIFFGADPGFLAVVQNPELRAGIPAELGRFFEVGWVGTIEASIIWDIPSLANIIHVTST